GGARGGQAAGLAPALGRGRQSARAATVVQGPQAHRRDAVLWPGGARVGLLPDAAARTAGPGAADDEERGQLRGVAVATRALAGGAGRGGRGDDPAGDVRREAAGRRRTRA